MEMLHNSKTYSRAMGESHGAHFCFFHLLFLEIFTRWVKSYRRLFLNYDQRSSFHSYHHSLHIADIQCRYSSKPVSSKPVSLNHQSRQTTDPVGFSTPGLSFLLLETDLSQAQLFASWINRLVREGCFSPRDELTFLPRPPLISSSSGLLLARPPRS